jgi:N-acetylglucosamine-6-phosphate deacetylase
MNAVARVFLFATLVSAALVSAGCQQPVDASVQILVGGTLLDGRGGAPLDYPVVVVEEGKIRAVGPQTHVPIPTGSRKIDTTGYTIRPADGGGPLVAGAPADLVLVDSAGKISRRMVQGTWQ